MEPIHIVHGDSAGGTLRLALPNASVLVRRDLLTIGPCHLEPVEHRRLRLRHWGVEAEPHEPFEAFQSEIGARPIVLWSTHAWSDCCYTWLVLDDLTRLGVTRERIRVARPAGKFSCSLGTFPPDALASASIEDCTQDFIDEGVALWRAYASPSPLAFDELHHRGSPSFPHLKEAARGHSDWFPWQRARLRLSDVDAALFDWIGDEWRDLSALVERFDLVDDLMRWIGDSSLFDRVRAWRDAGAVEMQGELPKKGSRVRLTPAGRALRENGADSVAEFPPVWIGGCHINDPSAPWVRNADGRIVAG
jgi:hypothetical protein